MRSFTNRPRLDDERGFTLAMVMGIMLIASIVSVAAFQAANGDLNSSAENRDRKVALAAAESGVAWYQAKLTSDPNYWQLCDTGRTSGVQDPVNQPNASAASRRWRTVRTEGVQTAEFSLAVLPASGTTCNTADPSTSMLNTIDGSFRVRSTGRYNGERRTLITSFRRSRFLDYVYFTDYETLDYTIGNGNDPNCAKYRASRPSACTEIQFADADEVNGPLHTNDDLIVCGTPTFGRRASDNVHVSGPAPGYAPNGGCANSPVFRGTFRAAQRSLQMPPSNSELSDLTTDGWTGAGYRLRGTWYIRFNGNGTMTLDSQPGLAQNPSGNPFVVNVPPNGVIYVDEDTSLGCSTGGQTPAGTAYSESEGCANVYVSGTANKPVTIAAFRDIIVAPTLATTSTNTANQFTPETAGSSFTDADLEATGVVDANEQLNGTVQIGLIANGFVRVYHRIDPNNGSLASGVRNVRIDAAILSLQHSFIVDNWAYGASPGTLTVHGAIAQRFRGPVGTGSGGGISTGYVKQYWYDDRLKFRAPPYFLNPVNAAWSASRQNEQVPPV